MSKNSFVKTGQTMHRKGLRYEAIRSPGKGRNCARCAFSFGCLAIRCPSDLTAVWALAKPKTITEKVRYGLARIAQEIRRCIGQW